MSVLEGEQGAESGKRGKGKPHGLEASLTLWKGYKQEGHQRVLFFV